MNEGPVKVSAGLVGDSDWGGIEGDASVNAQPIRNMNLSLGARGTAGYGGGVASGNIEPYAKMQAGPVSVDASQQFYGAKTKDQMVTGKGQRQITAGVDLPVGSSKFSANIQRVLDDFSKNTRVRVGVKIPF